MRGLDSQLTLQKLEVFCAVAERQSVSRAAEHLYITQPVVTSHIRSLEEKLGVKLLRREGRGIALTDDGQRVLRWAHEILTSTQELHRELRGTASNGSGEVALSSSMSVGSYMLPGLICDFQLENPDGMVHLSISNPLIALDAVRSGTCDFAVIILSPDQNLEGLIAQPLWNEPLALVSAPNSKWVGDEASREQISRLPFISTSNGYVMKQLEEALLRANGIASRRIVMALGHPEAQKEAVRRDIGVTLLLQASVASDVARGNLRLVRTPSLEMILPHYIIQRRDKQLSQFQSAFKRFLQSSNPSGVTRLRD